MSYEYDVFFSYKRDPESDEWHRRLKDKIAFWLKKENQGVEARIFFDREDIRTGLRWKQKLSDALKKSKCIVCIWSPDYFKSKYCLSEWMVFEARGNLFSTELVGSAHFCDGENFPEPAKARQSMNFEEYASTIPVFWETVRADEFEQKFIRKFAKDVAAILKAAPPFSANFPIDEAGNELVLPEAIPIRRIGNG